MYGFETRSLMIVGLAIEAPRNFLHDLRELLQFARSLGVRKIGAKELFTKRTLLRSFDLFKRICMGRVKKSSLKYCGPIRVLRQIGQIAYRIDLPPSILVHPNLSC